MTVVYITLAILVVLYIIIMVIDPVLKYKKVLKVVSTLKGFKEYRGKPFDFSLEDENKKIYFKTLFIPKNSQITINDKSTWVLSWGGSTINKGRSYPNKKYLSEIEDFAKLDIHEEKDTLKVFLIYPTTENIVRYINESDLECVDISKTVYGYKLMKFNNIDQELKIVFGM